MQVPKELETLRAHAAQNSRHDGHLQARTELT